jgi:putative transposase
MREARLRGVIRRRGFVITTRRDASSRPAADLVNRSFVAEAANRLSVADMTHVATRAGFSFLAIGVDVWSRCIVSETFDAVPEKF